MLRECEKAVQALRPGTSLGPSAERKRAVRGVYGPTEVGLLRNLGLRAARRRSGGSSWRMSAERMG